MELIYKETESKSISPGKDWIFWGMRITNEVEKAVWRKEVSEEEAQEFYDKQMIEEMGLLN